MLIIGQNMLSYREEALRFRFRTKKLADLYYDNAGASAYPAAVVDAFFEVMTAIVAAADEREFYNLKSLHFEQLGGQAGKLGERSMRLNDQYRLILTIERDAEGRYCYIINISKHYR